MLSALRLTATPMNKIISFQIYGSHDNHFFQFSEKEKFENFTRSVSQKNLLERRLYCRDNVTACKTVLQG